MIFHLLGFSSNKWVWCSSISLPGCFRVGGEEGKDRSFFLSSHNLVFDSSSGLCTQLIIFIYNQLPGLQIYSWIHSSLWQCHTKPSQHCVSASLCYYLFTDKVKCIVTKPKSLGVPPQSSALLCTLLWLRPSSSLDMQAICGTFSILLLFHLRSCIMPKYCHFCFSEPIKHSAASKLKHITKPLFLQLAFSCHSAVISLKSPHSSSSDVFYLQGLAAFRPSKLESALQHFLHSTHKQESKLASFPHPPSPLLPATPFLFTAHNNLQNPSFLWCRAPHRLLFTWALCFTSAHTR